MSQRRFELVQGIQALRRSAGIRSGLELSLLIKESMAAEDLLGLDNEHAEDLENAPVAQSTRTGRGC